MTSREQLHWLQMQVWLHVSLWENKTTSHLISYLSEQFHCDLHSVASFEVFFSH